MTSAAAIATKPLINGHPWINRFPTFTSTIIQKLFFGRVHRQNYTPKLQTDVAYAKKADSIPFTAKLQPIQRLTDPAAPYTLGPNMLRAFIYARQQYPDIPVRWASERAIQAVYESNRIDGFPRVMFNISKEVEKLLIGKLHGFIRRRFKMRGRRAFIDALDQLRRERDDFRCDLDIAFTLHPGLVKIPYEEIVSHMKIMLTSVNTEITERGLRNASMSKKYLAERPEKPEHALHYLAKYLAREAGIKKGEQPSEDDLLNMMAPLPESTVKGRMIEAVLMEDGTYVPLETPTKRREISSKRSGKSRASYPFQNAPDPTIPAEYLVKSTETQVQETVSTSSSETKVDNSVRDTMEELQSLSPQRNTPPTIANVASHEKQPSDDFDWLFGDESTDNSSGADSNYAKKTANESARKVTLDWPPPESKH